MMHNANTGCGPCSPVVSVDHGQVFNQVHNLRYTTDRLECLLGNLEGKLNGVLRLAEPPCKEVGDCMPSIVPVADSLRSIDLRINRFCAELESITSRIDI